MKTEYEYVGDDITGSTLYYWDVDDSLWIYMLSIAYSYNENEYLIQIADENSVRQVIDYEEGHGNAVLFWYSPSSYLFGKPQLK